MIFKSAYTLGEVVLFIALIFVESADIMRVWGRKVFLRSIVVIVISSFILL